MTAHFPACILTQGLARQNQQTTEVIINYKIIIMQKESTLPYKITRKNKECECGKYNRFLCAPFKVYLHTVSLIAIMCVLTYFII